MSKKPAAYKSLLKRVSIKYLVAVSISSSLITSSCKKKQESSEMKGLATSKLWPSKKVSLCFNRDLSDIQNYDEFAIPIAKAIAREYTVESAGFEWVGLDDCRNVSNADAMLLLQYSANEPRLKGVASQIGQFNVGPPNPVFRGASRPAVAIFIGSIYQSSGSSRSMLDFELEFTVLHELGHLAGLFHEHAHPRSTCRVTQESALDKFEQMPPGVAEHAYLDYGTPYDPNSIMNYCVAYSAMKGQLVDRGLRAIPSEASLSMGDKQMLRGIYSRMAPGYGQRGGGYSARELVRNSNPNGAYAGKVRNYPASGPIRGRPQLNSQIARNPMGPYGPGMPLQSASGFSTFNASETDSQDETARRYMP